jgi:UDP-N-acetylglucosamine--N-acetylmuramyl-(pentapeptide) pyrophosphoryl-undecaprenol N-acetylglucosamine transferase
MVLIPLTRQASRGDQILNAQSFEKEGLAHVLAEENLTPSTLAQTVNQVYASREKYHAACSNYAGQHATDTIVKLIHQVAKK